MVAESVPDEVEGEHGKHDGHGREEDEVRGVEEVGASVIEHGAPAGGGGWYAKPEKAQGGLGEHGSGHADSSLHDERLQQVGQDVPCDEAQIGGAESAGSFDKLTLPQGEHLGTDEARIVDPAGDREGEDEIDETGTEKRDEGDGKQDAGKGEKGVGEIDVDDGVGESSVKACEAAGNKADSERGGYNGDGYEQRDAGTEKDAGEDVSAEFVRAEAMNGAGEKHAGVEIETGRIKGSELRRQEGGEDESCEQNKPGRGERLPGSKADRQSESRRLS